MSSDCKDREERLVSLLYEDGDPEELAEIRAHLATCAACRDEFAELSSTRDLLKAWPDVAHAPSAFAPNALTGLGDGAGGGAERKRWAGFRSFLPSLAAAAAVVVMFAASATVLRFQVGPEGRLHVGFGSPSAPAASSATFVTRDDLDQGLAQTAQYLEALVQATREQDRQVLLHTLEQSLRDQNSLMGDQVTAVINSAFDEIDRRRRSDLGVMLSSIDDLQVITSTELQRINAVLASLAPPAGSDQE